MRIHAPHRIARWNREGKSSKAPLHAIAQRVGEDIFAFTFEVSHHSGLKPRRAAQILIDRYVRRARGEVEHGVVDRRLHGWPFSEAMPDEFGVRRAYTRDG